MAFLCASSAHALTLSTDDEAARDVALQWLRLVDSGNYKDTSDMVSEEVRVPQQWLGYLAAHRAPLGPVRNRQVVELKHRSTVRGAPEVRLHAIFRFKTSFERKPMAMEEVVLTKMSCCWEVSGYTIFEPAKWNETTDHAGEFSEPEPERH
jgi:uncharacterized protein DUF4019